MSRKGFYFNQNLCVGCRTCQVACKDKNDLPVGTLFRRVDTYETGSFPNVGSYHLSRTCNHCQNPACVQSCPTGAMYIDEADGTVQHNDDACIGCKSCMMACPYEVPQYLQEIGIVRKCDACKPLRENGEQPACVGACPLRALEFGDVDDLAAAHPDAVDQIAVLPSPETTSPTTRIQAKGNALDADFRQMVI